MNGSPAKIEIFKPFGEAYELTKRILFQPFDLGKWCVIGFAAFLAGNVGGGSGFSWPGRFNHFQGMSHHDHPWAGAHWQTWGVVAIVVLVVVIAVFALVFAWISARGRFIFTDCIVRNRAAIVAPWHEYRKEGNGYFLFTLAVAFATMLVVGLFALLVFVLFGLLRHSLHDEPSTLFLLFLIPLFVFWICFVIYFGLVSYFMVPIMYIRRAGPVAAFYEVNRLVLHHLGVFVLFCLFTIVLFLGVIMVGGIVSCLTCCIAALPYVGTVILLPLFVCLRAFGLCFLRQFGPEYDVWAGAHAAPQGPPPVQIPSPAV